MLSICIPVYNTIITTLVEELYKQCKACKIPFEIICLDDASALYKEENKIILTYQNVKYDELPQNIGRAVIRNLLAEQALYPTILYLDSDISIPDADFIKKYLECLKDSNPSVIVGGISYDKKLTDQTQKLHFTYGHKRESKSVSERVKKPYSSFLTGNLLIKKKLVQDIQFLSSLREYGHEDTLFCMELKKQAIPVLHIDNPALHEGLENNEIFLKKQLAAVKNLSALILQGYDVKSISIYDFYLRLKKYHLTGIFVWGFTPIQPLVKRNLESGRTSRLELFDLLRLFELAVYLKKLK